MNQVPSRKSRHPVAHALPRITNAVATRLQRSSPDTPMKYNDWVIPPNVCASFLSHSKSIPANKAPQVPVGMTSFFIHHNEDIFPDSQSFIPERWMDPTQRKHLERYLVAFSKGARQCIGIPYVYRSMTLERIVH